MPVNPLAPRCTATAQGSGQRCQNPCLTGYPVCIMHGAGGKVHSARSNEIKAMRAIENFVKAISPDDPEADVLVGFRNEYLRCIGRIRWYDDQIALLPGEQELIWGKTRREDKEATEFSGTDFTYEARQHMWLVLQDGERRILREIAKLWIQANLDTKRIEVEASKVDALDRAITRILEKSGLDPHSDEVRQLVSRELQQIKSM